MTIAGERTEQLDIFCHVTGFTSDFLSFMDVELIRFFNGAIQPTDGLSVHAKTGNCTTSSIIMGAALLIGIEVQPLQHPL